MTPFRLRRKITASFIIIFLVWATGFLWFRQQIPQTTNNFAENSADAIIVLTGDDGRLAYGIELLAENKAKVLFISGAGAQVTVADIMHHVPEEMQKKIDLTKIALGHEAVNTIGNAREIKEWLSKENYKKIILVTSNYHMPRSLLEVSSALPAVTITPAPVIDNDNELIFSEYHKYFASILRHLFVSVTGNK